MDSSLFARLLCVFLVGGGGLRVLFMSFAVLFLSVWGGILWLLLICLLFACLLR